MRATTITLGDITLPVYSCNTVVVGSGAAGLNAADRLFTYGQRDIALVTEGLDRGTSITGSDKQTYYKLTLAGAGQDSVIEMAETLASGGAMHGDIAVIEAALSAQCFYRLVDIGVPFPHDEFGQYVGYKTDHDPRQRATSAGPLTSRFMVERLQAQVKAKGISIYKGYQIIRILTDAQGTRCVGLLALDHNHLEDPHRRYVLFNCTNVVYATGGPAGLYQASVYPPSQIGATGLAFEAGAQGQNLTESQYGIASIKFRWNLSGTYQQVLPRYVSTDQEGRDEREFLLDYFPSPGKMLDAIFLKGYQWPFDPRKVVNYGSSLIDLLVYNETVLKGRRVWLDYTRNPSCAIGQETEADLDFSQVGSEAYEYLERSGALFGRPIDRLAHMNQPAIDLYRSHGIDLASEYLEIAVCAQHNNGGLTGDIWWESNLAHFFPVGEVNGSHGVYRPGGSALNSGQVGSARAAQLIAARYREEPPELEVWLSPEVKAQIQGVIDFGQGVLNRSSAPVTPHQLLRQLQELTTRVGAHIRSLSGVKDGIQWTANRLRHLQSEMRINDLTDLPWAFRVRDLLITQYVYLSAIADYIAVGGQSRGSYLVYNPQGQLPLDNLPEGFRFLLDDGQLASKVQTVTWDAKTGECICRWEPVRRIPEGAVDGWFEEVWGRYREGKIIGSFES